MLGNLLMVAGSTGTNNVSTAMTTAFTNGANEMESMIATVAPIGIAVVIAGAVVTFGIKFFKRITAKA